VVGNKVIVGGNEVMLGGNEVMLGGNEVMLGGNEVMLGGDVVLWSVKCGRVEWSCGNNDLGAYTRPLVGST